MLDRSLIRIRAEAELRGETLVQAVRHHLMLGVIERVARSPDGAAFVFRGGNEDND